MDLKILAHDGFSGGRNLSGNRRKICVDTADDNDWLLSEHFNSPQIDKKI
jgi:hypothetical protein